MNARSVCTLTALKNITCLGHCWSWEAAEQSVDCPQKRWVERIKTHPMHPSEVSAVGKWLPGISCPSLVKFNCLFRLDWFMQLVGGMVTFKTSSRCFVIDLMRHGKSQWCLWTSGNLQEVTVVGKRHRWLWLFVEAAWVLWVFPLCREEGC